MAGVHAVREYLSCVPLLRTLTHLVQATVLLNANVAFLAIPSVDTGENISRTPQQIISYISVMTGAGSILIGLLLQRQYRVKPKDTVDEAVGLLSFEIFRLLIYLSSPQVSFLNARTHPTRGVETLAILYSLPYALLIWRYVRYWL